MPPAIVGQEDLETFLTGPIQFHMLDALFHTVGVLNADRIHCGSISINDLIRARQCWEIQGFNTKRSPSTWKPSMVSRPTR